MIIQIQEDVLLGSLAALLLTFFLTFLHSKIKARTNKNKMDTFIHSQRKVTRVQFKDQVIPLRKQRSLHHTLSLDEPIPVFKPDNYTKTRGYTEKRKMCEPLIIHSPKRKAKEAEEFRRNISVDVFSSRVKIAPEVLIKEEEQPRQEDTQEEHQTTTITQLEEETEPESLPHQSKELEEKETEPIQPKDKNQVESQTKLNGVQIWQHQEEEKIREKQVELDKEEQLLPMKVSGKSSPLVLQEETVKEYYQETKKKKYSQNQVLNGIFEELLYDLDHIEDFELKKEDKKNKVKLYMKTYPDGPLKEYPRYVIEREEVMGVYPAQILELLSHMDKQDEWNKHCKLCTKLGKIEDSEVSFTHLKIPFPLSDRGFLERRIDVEIGDLNYIMLTSAGTESIPVPNKKITIAYTFLSAYVVKPIKVNNEVVGSSLIFVNQGNFGGSVPKSFVRMFAAKNVMEYITTVVKVAKKIAV